LGVSLFFGLLLIFSVLTVPGLPSPPIFSQSESHLSVSAGAGTPGAAATTSGSAGGVPLWTPADLPLKNGSSEWIGTGAQMVFDPAGNYVLAIFVGDGSGRQTWTYAGGNWTNLTATAGTAPSAGAAAPLVYDAADGYVLWVGASYDPLHYPTNATLQTWSFSDGRWTNLTSPTPARGTVPSARYGALLAYDVADAYTVLHGGYSGCNQYRSCYEDNDTWSYVGGVWRNVTSSDPQLRPEGGSAMAYDPQAGQIILFGAGPYFGQCELDDQVGCSASAPVNETWGYLAGNWTNLTSRSPVSPPPLGAQLTVFVASMTFDVTKNWLFLEGGTQFGNGYGGAWEYQNASWTPVYPYFPLWPGIGVGILMTYDARDGYLLILSYGPASGDDAGQTLALWTFTVGPPPAPPSVASFSASPNPDPLGATVTLTVRAGGGIGPLSYSYSGLPPGCESANQATVACIPTATGTYLVKVYATDAANRSSGVSSLELTVGTGGSPSADWVYVAAAFVSVGLIAFAAVVVVRYRRSPSTRGTSGQSPKVPP